MEQKRISYAMARITTRKGKTGAAMDDFFCQGVVSRKDTGYNQS